ILYDRYENSSIVGIAGAISIILFLGAHATSQFVGGARLFESMTSLPYWVGLVLFSIVVLIYTALGGIRGVSTAIIVQGVTMTIAVFCLVFATISKLSPIEISMRKIASMDPMLISPWRWSPVFNFSLWCIFGLANISQPHGVTATLTYKDTKTMHRAMILGAIITIIWTFPLQLMGNLARVIYPNLEVADYAVPMLSATVLPPYLSGIILAGVAGAIQSTVGSITLVISASIVRDFYLTFVNPKASSKQQKSVTQFVTAAICIIVFLIALRPPKALEWVIMFALGGLAAAYFFPLLLGLYWWRANEYGACVSMGGGLLTYILSKLGIIPSFFGMDPVVISMLVSGILLVAVSLATPKPSKRVVMTYFGKGLNR
ncbi:MAG TPA: sodium/panthothenate symporter, partial [Thermoanaerobacterales bacterium]|nr:sodium/panthothenate symporter [Thermoanaerobacterales bacterium]